MSIPSTGIVALGKEEHVAIASPIDVRGLLRISGASISNTQTAPHAPAFLVGEGDDLRLTDVEIRGRFVGGTKANRAILVDHPTAQLTLTRTTFVDGEGVVVFRGKIDWAGGGNRNTYAYGLYLGNNMAGDDYIATGVVDGCKFEVGRAETAVRLMGFNGAIRGCTFSADTPKGREHQKESLQARHGRFAITDCISHSWLIGSLDPSIDGGKHVDYAQRIPTYGYVANHNQYGYLTVSGKSFVAIERLNIRGLDPRGVGNAGGAAIWTKSYKTIHGEHRPRIYIRDSSVDAFGSFCDANVIVGPGCTFKSKPLPVSPKWDANEFERIADAANKYAPPITQVPPEPAPPEPAPPVIPAPTDFLVKVPAGVKRIIVEIE